MDSVIPVFSLKELLAQDNEQLDKLREVLINRLNFYCRFLFYCAIICTSAAMSIAPNVVMRETGSNHPSMKIQPILWIREFFI